MFADKDSIFGSPNGVLRVSSVFAGALIIWAVVMGLSVVPYPVRTDVPNFEGPILSIELANNDDALKQALGVKPPLESTLQRRVHEVVEFNTELDFVFIVCYTAFLIGFTCAVFPGHRKTVLRWICFFIIVGAVADCFENIGIFHALYHDDATSAWIKIPSLVKWWLLNLVIAVDGIFLLAGTVELCLKKVQKLLGLALFAAGIMGIAGLVTGHHEWLQHGMTLFALAPIATLGLAVARSDPGTPSPVVEHDQAMAEEFAHLYGPLVIADRAAFFRWLASDDSLAIDVRGRLDIPLPRSEAEFNDELIARAEQCLREFAYSPEILSSRYNGTQNSEPLKRREDTNRTIFATAVHLVTAKLQNFFGVAAAADADHRIRQRNILFLQGRNRGLKVRTFDWASAAGVNHSALCLSGGGIRSATFNLGILQGLSRFGILDQFSYLSTVSGGGFVGGWLSALKLRTGKLDINGRVPAVEHLRDYSNYLSPEVGLLSADTWTLVAIYLRNLLLTWIVIIPCMAAALMAPRLVFSYYTRTVLPGVLYVLVAVGFIALMLGIGYISAHLPSHDLAGTDALRRLRHRATLFAIVALIVVDVYFPWQYPPFDTRWFLPAIAMELLLVVPMLVEFNGEVEFVARGLVPLLVSAFSLTSCWKWLSESSGPESALRHPPSFLLGGAIAVLVPWAVTSLYARANKLNQYRGGSIDAERMDDFDFQLGLSMLMLFIAAVLATVFGWFMATRNWITYTPELYVCFAAPVLIGMYLLAGTLMAGSISRRTRDDDEEWWARAGAWLLIAAFVWMAATVCVLYLPSLSVQFVKDIYSKWTASQLTWSHILKSVAAVAGALSGVASVLAGFFGKTAGNKKSDQEQSGIVSKLAPIGAGIGLIYIVVALAAVTDLGIASLGRRFQLASTDPLLLIGVAVAFAIAGSLAGVAINTNKFSLHYYWRNRIVRAYLGASNRESSKPDPFTGFSTDDNVQMWQLRRLKDHRPFHVLNVALNLTGTRNLAWQERKAESFTISPLHCGTYSLGYRDSQYYGRVNYSGKEGISLGAAMALSGAAVSPNMGYMVSSPVLRFLMTLFNLRLGAWLGNPGKYGEKTFRLGAPWHSIGPIVCEAFGLVDQYSRWVYLSDGGHFENLGLYEMVRRRCRFIVVSDASTDADYDFESLAMSVRKIRIDFNASVVIERAAPIGRFVDGKGAYYAVGKIEYPDGTTSKLVYIKASMTGNEPEDVLNYQRTNNDFPQESIADQFFTESQFESYRALGAHIVETMFPEGTQHWAKDFNAWYEHLERQGQPAPDELKKAVTTL